MLFAGLAMIRWTREGGSRPLLPVFTIVMVTLRDLVFWGDPRFHFAHSGILPLGGLGARNAVR